MLVVDDMYVSYAERAAGVSIEPGPFSLFFGGVGGVRGGQVMLALVPRSPTVHTDLRTQEKLYSSLRYSFPKAIPNLEVCHCNVWALKEKQNTIGNS